MGNKLKILVVEDEALTARCICEDLRDLDVDPLKPVPKGELAVELAISEKPDLILMDIRLAGAMNGIEAAQEIKERLNVPIVFMSGFATEYVIEKAQIVEYIEFLEKPVTIELLEPIINKLKKN